MLVAEDIDDMSVDEVTDGALPDYPALLVLGGYGVLGSRVFERAAALVGNRLHAVRRSRSADISSLSSMREHIGKLGWRGTVINCAGMTDVDGAETESGRQYAWQVNLQGARNVARMCALHGARLVHVSSDFVLWTQPHPQDEAAMSLPVGMYARTKAGGEMAVAAAMPSATIARLSSLYDAAIGKNFGSTMLRRLLDGGPLLRADAARMVCPTPADDAAAALVSAAIAPEQPAGILHYACGPATTWHKWAMEAASLVAPTRAIERCQGASCGYKAHRPSVWLGCSRWDSLGLAPRRTWQDALALHVSKVLEAAR